MAKIGILMGLLACMSTFACGDDGDDNASENTGGSGGASGSGGTSGSGGDPIEIEGSWASDFGTDVIDDGSWSSDFGTGPTVSEIVEFSNDDNAAITLSPDDAEFDPGTYGRNVWTEISGDTFFYCSVSFAQPSAEEAVSESQPADDSDPETGGCGDSGFPWTKLTRQ